MLRRALLVVALGLPAFAPRLSFAASAPAHSDTTHDEDMGSGDSAGSGDSSGDSSPTTHGFLDPDTPAEAGDSTPDNSGGGGGGSGD